MKKLFVLSVLLLLSVVAVQASTPQFTLVTNFVATLNNTENQNIGQFIVTRAPYLPNNTNITAVSSFVVQNYDTIQWDGNGSILIRNANLSVIGIVTQGQKYLFGTQGQYTYVVNGDETNVGTIIVSAETVPTIGLAFSGPPIQYTTLQPVILDTQEKIFNISANVSLDVLAGTYNYTLLGTYGNNSVIKTGNMIVPTQQTWVLKNLSFQLNYSMRAGDIAQIGQITIENTGNDNIEITSSSQGNGSFFIVTQPRQTLFRRSTTSFGITVQVPNGQADGVYNSTIILSGGTSVVTVPLMIYVHDTTPPIIQDIKISDTYVHHPMSLTAIIQDNIGVTNATVSYAIANGSYTDPRIMYADQQRMWFNFTPDSLEPYTFNVCAYDKQGNVACNTTTARFSTLSLVQRSATVKLPSRKFGKTSEEILFNLTEQIPDPITLTLVSFQSDLVASNVSNDTTENSYKINIIDGDGNIRPIQKIGDSVQVNHPGQIKIQVQATALSQFQGVIRFTMPAYVNNESDMSISGRFISYDIPSAFEKDWFGKKFTCGVTDTGDLDTSFYMCSVQFPISTDVQNLAVPVTPEQLALQQQNMTNTIQNYDAKLSFRDKVIGTIVSLLVIAILLMIYATQFYPYLRIKLGGD